MITSINQEPKIKTNAKTGTARKPSTAGLLYAEAGKFGREESFIANVCLTCGRPVKKLRGLLGLLNAGLFVRTAAFDMWTLIISGEDGQYKVIQLGELETIKPEDVKIKEEEGNN